jgi:hypothetical protein
MSGEPNHGCSNHRSNRRRPTCHICIFTRGDYPVLDDLQEAGFAPALSLLIMIPLVNLIVLYVIAFSDWKLDASRVPPI